MSIKNYVDYHRFAFQKQYEIILEYERRLADLLTDSKRAELIAANRSDEYMAADLDPDEIFTHRDVWVRFERAQQAGTASLQVKQQFWQMEQQIKGIEQVCGLILQSAKQGLSTTYGRPSNWPSGRTIGSETLSNAILQARNQTTHFEEGNPSTPVRTCFANLENSLGIILDLTKNMAKNVVFEVFGWKTYNDYEVDILSNF